MTVPCWYGDAEHRPTLGSCPATCGGGTTHAERQGDGVERRYCSDHSYWRALDVGRQRLRALRADELP